MKEHYTIDEMQERIERLINLMDEDSPVDYLREFLHAIEYIFPEIKTDYLFEKIDELKEIQKELKEE